MRTFLFSLILLISIPFYTYAAQPTFQDKIDQMIMIGFRGTTVSKGSNIENILKNSNVGGVILFDYDSPIKTYGRNIKTKTQVTALTASLQKNAKTPLFIAIDEEGGQVSRLKRIPGFVPLKSATTLGKYSTIFVESQNKLLAKTIKSLGINVNFAPVLDLTSKDPAKPLTKQQRTFSSNPNTVTSYASAVIRGMNSQSIVSAGKHFPGLGEASIDTHNGLATLSSHTPLALEPYKILSKENTLPAVMVGHVIDPGIDPLLPASLSSAHINLLRNNIGFGGVIFSDDLDMRAIRDTRSIGDAAVASVKAGIDVVIISNNITSYNPNAFFNARSALLSAVQNKIISESQINASYARIMALKKQYLILR
jgi:beta-N-acetylhexosaminidase